MVTFFPAFFLVGMVAALGRENADGTVLLLTLLAAALWPLTLPVCLPLFLAVT